MFLVVLLTLFIHFFKCCCFRYIFFCSLFSLAFCWKFNRFFSLIVCCLQYFLFRLSFAGGCFLISNAIVLYELLKWQLNVSSNNWQRQKKNSQIQNKTWNGQGEINNSAYKKTFAPNFFFQLSTNHINISGKNQMQNFLANSCIHQEYMQIGLFTIHYIVYIFHSLASFRAKFSVYSFVWIDCVNCKVTRTKKTGTWYSERSVKKEKLGKKHNGK